MKKVYLIDLDGTMFKGTTIIEDAKKFLDHCIENQHPFLFLTNNSSRTPKQVVEHMKSIGFSGIETKDIYTSSMAAVDTVAKMSDKRKAYFIGQDGLELALKEKGFIIDDENPDFLFIGLNKTCDYIQYSKALSCALKGAQLIGTNNDRLLAHESGYSLGNGSIVAMFEYATSLEAMKIGKPHKPIMEGVLSYLNKTADEVIIVGDNLETDIQCGINAKVESVLVTTGVHQKSDCEKLNIYPDRIIDSMLELL